MPFRHRLGVPADLEDHDVEDSGTAMGLVEEVDVRTRSPARFAEVLDDDEAQAFLELGPRFAQILEGRALWHVNTTSVGGGVAEMLRQQIGYTRGSGVDGRWAVISGEPDFFRITKRLHHALHGMVGDGSPLGDDERASTTRRCRRTRASCWTGSSPPTWSSSMIRRPPASRPTCWTRARP